MIFFDGVCVFCNSFVNFLMRADARAEILFSPMQGETAAKFSLPRSGDPGEWAIAYVDEKGIHEGADAVLLVLGRLGGLLETSRSFHLVSRARERVFLRACVKEPLPPFRQENRLPRADS